MRPGHLIPDEAEAGVVRTMYRWLAEEQRSIRSIVLEPRRLGLRPRRGGQWARTSVARILTSEFYAGRAFFNRARHEQQREGPGPRYWRPVRPRAEWIEIPMTALVTPELFDAARAQVARNRSGLVGRPPLRVYLLRGLLRCGPCGAKYRSLPNHGRRL